MAVLPANLAPLLPWRGVFSGRSGARSTHVLTTITNTAERLAVHRSTVWRLISTDPSFPPVVYVRPRCPRIRVADLDRWLAGRTAGPVLGDEVSPELLGGHRRGPQRRRAA
jgi:predicted DNA-binding transcriptional regulator AlpA